VSRSPVFAGSFYPADAGVLWEEVSALSPLVKEEDKEEIIGGLVPHAGYLYSGRVAGEVFGRIKARQTFVIIGPNHTGEGHRFSLSMESWITPIGGVKTDIPLAKALKRSTALIVEDVSAHSGEHSIEVQLPFIKRFFPESMIVPLCVASASVSELKETAEAIVKAAGEVGRDIAVLASSDMTHYETRCLASAKDKHAIDALLSLDPERLAETVAERDISMCGWAPSVMMLYAARAMGAVNARLLKYADSGEVTGNTSEVVGYAGVIVS